MTYAGLLPLGRIDSTENCPTGQKPSARLESSAMRHGPSVRTIAVSLPPASSPPESTEGVGQYSRE